MALEPLAPIEFFELLYGDLNGYIAIASFPGDGKFNRNSGPNQSAWFHWPTDRDALMVYALQSQKKDLYVPPVLFHSPESRKASNAKTGRMVYADADACDPRVFHLTPTMVVQTSPGHHQVYWAISDIDENQSTSEAPKILSRMSRRVALAHQNQGCDASGWDVGQLLRVPKTTNNKPQLDQPYLVTATAGGQMYTLAMFEEQYPANEPTRHYETVTEPEPAPEDLVSLDEALHMVSGHGEIMRLYQEECDPNGRQRSDRMWRLMGLLARSHVPIAVAYVLSWYAGCNKYRQDDRPGSELWRELAKAYNDPANVHEATALDGDELAQWQDMVQNLNIQDPEDDFDGEPADLNESAPRIPEMGKFVPVPDAELTEGFHGFLTDVERSSHVPRNTILDRYVGWAATRTDAPATYQRAAGLTLLATVFGDFAYPATKFPMGGLNLWFMMLGGTTRSRKSTARRLMLKSLDMLSGDHYVYDLGSDATAEGLAAELAEHPGRSMLFNRDEVHGLFTEAGEKHYMSGFKETLTELYDGQVRGKLRATGNRRTDSTNTVFNVFFSGITERIAKELTPDDFASGFLTRFLFTHAEPPPRTRAAVYMQQAEDTETDTDIEHEEIIADIGRSRGFWENLATAGKQVPIGFDNEAWDRLNTYAWSLTETAEEHTLHTMLAPSADRMVKNTIKVACILAMADRCMEVGMVHVLKAVHLAEEWFSQLIVVAAKVRESQWHQQQAEITEQLATLADPVLQNKLYAKVRSRYKPREFEELMQALENSSVIARKSGGQGMYIKKLGW